MNSFVRDFLSNICRRVDDMENLMLKRVQVTQVGFMKLLRDHYGLRLLACKEIAERAFPALERLYLEQFAEERKSEQVAEVVAYRMQLMDYIMQSIDDGDLDAARVAKRKYEDSVKSDV